MNEHDDTGWPEPMDTVEMAHRIRRHAIEMTHRGKSSHVGSILSMTDIIAVLYGHVLRIDPKNPRRADRDRFILSKGHAGAGVYAALAERSFFSTDKLINHYQNGSTFSGHVSHKGIPGVEFSTGSLGHGLGVGAGMALAAKKQSRNHRVFVVLSDGECDEGSNWEAILFAAHHKLDNLIVGIDYNKIQSLGSVSDTLALEPFADKWKAFGWNTLEVDGHNHVQLIDAYTKASANRSAPSVIICHTIKGKGISFMENQVLWHYRTPQGEEYRAAVEELKKTSDAKDA